MKQHLTPFRLANKIRMTRSLHKGTILVVEGDTDARVFNGFINNVCMIIPAEGKDNAVNALGILEKDRFQGILIVVDEYAHFCQTALYHSIRKWEKENPAYTVLKN